MLRSGNTILCLICSDCVGLIYVVQFVFFLDTFTENTVINGAVNVRLLGETFSLLFFL